MTTNNNENGGYRTPSKPPKMKSNGSLIHFEYFARSFLFGWLLLRNFLKIRMYQIWGFTFFFAIPILILISLAVSLLLVGSVSLWGYHILFWYSMPFIGLWIYKSLHLDNPLIWGKFQDWVKKRTE